MSKKKYYRNFFLNNMINAKKTWDGINKLINRKTNKNKMTKTLKCPSSNIVSSDPDEIANIFNSFFSSAGHEIASKISDLPISFNTFPANGVFYYFTLANAILFYSG